MATAASQTAFCTIGVDVGGTKVAAGAVTFPAGIVQGRRILPTLPQRGGEAVLADVERVVSELAAEAQIAGLRVSGIGVGLCEIVNRAGEVKSANCVAWHGLPVRQRLSKVAPTMIEADVRAAARAEALFGAGRNVSTFLYVSIGTGISSCLVIDGLPFIGSRGATGTMASGPLPGLNEAGTTLEQIASGPALVARFNQLGGKAQSGQDVLTAAQAGDANATRVVQSAAETLGGSIGSLINVLDPDLVVLGGGLGLSEGLYRNALISSARRHIWWEGHRNLAIVPATTGADAGIIGAAATAWKQFAVT